MISETDIVTGYRWYLGRTPSPDEIDANLRHYAGIDHEPLAQFQRILMSSAEFRTRRVLNAKLAHALPDELDRPRLVFLHIEKCGGSTLHEMLGARFAPERICPERHDGLGNWTINELAAYDLFSGHFDLSLCRSIPGRLRMVTMLREPKARLLSLYYFWRSHRPHPERDLYNLLRLARTHPVEEFFSHPDVTGHRNIRDAIAGQLIRTRGAMLLQPTDLLLADPAQALDRAWAVLRGFDAFGITERFEPSRRLLNHVLDLDMQPIAPRQVLAELARTSDEMVPVDRPPVSDRLDALLGELTGIDRALYARATALFEQRLAALDVPPPAPSRLRRVTARLRRVADRSRA